MTKLDFVHASVLLFSLLENVLGFLMNLIYLVYSYIFLLCYSAITVWIRASLYWALITDTYLENNLTYEINLLYCLNNSMTFFS